MSITHLNANDGTIAVADMFDLPYRTIKTDRNGYIVSWGCSPCVSVVFDGLMYFINGYLPPYGKLREDWQALNTGLRWRVVWASQRFVDGDHAICMRVARFLGAVV